MAAGQPTLAFIPSAFPPSLQQPLSQDTAHFLRLQLLLSCSCPAVPLLNPFSARTGCGHMFKSPQQSPLIPLLWLQTRVLQRRPSLGKGDGFLQAPPLS